MPSQLPNTAGTFTGFLRSLADLDIDLAITNDIKTVTLTATRYGKKSSVMFERHRLMVADEDFASHELGDILNALL